MNTRLILSLVMIVVLLTSVGGATAQSRVNAPAAPQAAVGTGFTVQGQLKNAGTPVNGNCDMTFRLYDAAATGTQIGSTITATVPVSNSLFTVMLNTNGEYGVNAFNGYARWLEVSVKCAGDTAFTTLTPRQQIAAAPYTLTPAGGNASSKPYYPFYRPQVLDLTTVDPDLKGFISGFTDGRYAYFVPYETAVGVASGKVARVDTQNFTASGIAVLDLTIADPDLTDGLNGFTDGRYGYFLSPSGKVARVDLQNFTIGSVTVLNLASVDSELMGFGGSFSDGRYGYFTPSQFGKVARVDLQNFSAGGVTVLNLGSIDPTLKGFSGFTDGRYGYLVPGHNGTSWFGTIVRVDLRDFSVSGVTVLDLTTVSSDLRGFFGGFADARYGYFIAMGDWMAPIGKLVRVDLMSFSTGGVSVLDLTTANPTLKGFVGGFTDGRYAYLAPSHNSLQYFGTAARVDLQNFTADGVTWQDLTTLDSDLTGFHGVFTDGSYGYFVPRVLQNGSTFHGKVVRIQLFSGAGAP